MRRLWAAAGAVAIGLVLAGPVPVAEAAACSGSSGVTVVVDYGALGGIQVGCAAGDPSSGLGALNAAGFSTTGTRKDGPGYVCRINGVPASDPCVVTPPTTAYWSYWHAPRDGAWTYGSTGAAGYDPAPGSVEGWAFGSGARPGIAAPAAPAPPPAPTTEAAPKPTGPPRDPAPPRATVPGAGSTSSGPRATAGGSSSDAASSGAATASGLGSSSGPAGPSGTPAATAAGAVDSSAGGTTVPPTSEPGPVAGTEPGSSSTPVGSVVIGAVLVAGLGTTGVLIARRRRPPA